MRDAAGSFVARVDFAWLERGVVVEVDGFAVHGTRSAFSRDLARQNRLVSLGWMVLRFTWDEVVRHPEMVLADLRPVLGAPARPMSG